MVINVGVFNAPPLFVLGLSELLSSSGYALETVNDPIPWLRQHNDAAMLIAVHDEADLNVVVEVKAEDPDSVVVTLIDEVSLPALQASLSAGAAGSIARDAAAAEVLLAFTAAMRDRVVMPASLARRLGQGEGGAASPSTIGDDQIDWLRALARGETVAVLSHRIGYSEREMYRRLRRLYSRMGVSNRTEALLKAARLGWIG